MSTVADYRHGKHCMHTWVCMTHETVTVNYLLEGLTRKVTQRL